MVGRPWLRQGRVPKPREIEINVLAYAPHFLGFAAAAASEELAAFKADARAAEETAPADGTVGATGFSRRRKRGRGKGSKGGRKREGCVPTGLSETAMWPDEDGEKKRREMATQLSPDKVRCYACSVVYCASCNRCCMTVCLVLCLWGGGEGCASGVKGGMRGGEGRAKGR